MPKVHGNSILTKLTTMNMLVSGVALLLASTGFFVYDQLNFRDSLVRTLSAQAQIIGSNSVSALLFNDPQAAAATLSALRSSIHVGSAGILTPDGRFFARYERTPADRSFGVPTMPTGQVETYSIGRLHVILMRQILSDGKLLGFVFLRADLQEASQRLRRYALIAAAVLLISFLLTMILTSRFRRSVAEPIVHLAETAQTVSRDQNYSLRAMPSPEHDEISVLISAFNEMLSQIQQRDTALQGARNELEQRVIERTRELVSANRELEAFSYSVSHDLRGPIDALNGFTYVLLRQYGEKLDPAARELIEHIRASSRRMVELIEDLLKLSRVTTASMKQTNVDLSAIARSIADELCRLDPARPVRFEIREVPPAQGDDRLLRIVLENLLRNSWKYTSRHPRACIEFGSTPSNGSVAYFVRDDGVGFDSNRAHKLFEPFQRMHSSEEFPGSGIGLATVQRIIHRHGGKIWADAEKGRGATFYFTLGLSG
jgi:signal transduction histidine kinase